MLLKIRPIIFLTFIFVLLISAVGCSNNSTATEPEAGDDKASNYPEKRIEMILTFPAGGNYDAAARILAKYAEKHLPNNQSLVLINKTGAGNTAGVTEIFNSEPDGYKIGFAQTSALTIVPNYEGKVEYEVDSFQPIMKVLHADGFIFVKEDAPWKTVDDWVEFVKENPGEFSVGALPTSVPLLEAINKKSGLDLKVVPFDSDTEAASALLGGHIDATIGTLGLMQANVDAGKVRALVRTTGKGVQLEDVPSLEDAGIMMAGDKMAGIIAPKGLPEEIVTILHESFKKAMEDPELQEDFKKAGLIPVYAGPEEFQAELISTSEKDKEILETVGLIK